MKKLLMPFLMCLRNGKFNPDEVFTGVDELEGLTIELTALDKSNTDIIKNPEDTDRLNFVITAGDDVISNTEFTMSQVFDTKIEFKWNDKQYQISFK